MAITEAASSAGMSEERLAHLEEVVRADLDAGLYHGASIQVARHGRLALDLVAGHADEARTKRLEGDTVFTIFSVTKTFINILALRAVELGRFALTTPMAESSPEFAGAPRERATSCDCRTHTAGLPGVWEVRPGMPMDRLGDIVDAVCADLHGVVEPGSRGDDSPMVNHALLGEALRRTDPKNRTIDEILHADLFRPLGMSDTALGIKPHMRDRHAFPDMRGNLTIRHTSSTTPGDQGLFAAESNQATWVGAASTTRDRMRLAEMLRNGGSLDGVRILSPRMIEMARQNWTGDLPNEIYRAVALRHGYPPPPAYLGLGFTVRGHGVVRHIFGTLTSPETFGNFGFGSSIYWVDPRLDLTFVALTTGLLGQAANIDRFQRLADIVVGAAE
jgi:CubicO group peptidase (beta-lactamase class C family)